MPFSPLEIGTDIQLISRLYLRKYALDDIFILYSFSIRILPPIIPPLNVPQGKAINGILAVTYYDNVPISRYGFYRS